MVLRTSGLEWPGSMPSLRDRGKWRGPELGAMVFGLIPSGRAHGRGPGAGFGGPVRFDRVTGSGTGLVLGPDRSGLPREGLVDPVSGDRLAELDGQVLRVGELGPRGLSSGPLTRPRRGFASP